ncbi:hypothetical protein FOA43_000953 [Brettanomyces nanus]|uniref:Mif2/CENP-C cupin domain-containing protein n=1 Tax=Eeniella nana TaxID=13502 RepID=A0A875RWJ0_EENNA|nr:uncharacterized protein FOA43_000953 [Brettanomyces nanus]QPG73641.1 hypothetical protein FOA43_000953 [Brettanomyces nanus]
MTRTPKKNANGLEDLEDFFLSDDEYKSPTTKRLQNTRKNPVKVKVLKVPSKTSERVTEEAKRLRNIPTEYVSSSDDEEASAEDGRADAMIHEAAIFGSPIKPKLRLHKINGINASGALLPPLPNRELIKQNSSPRMKKSSRLTKDIALHKKTRNKKFDVYAVSTDEEDGTSERSDSHDDEHSILSEIRKSRRVEPVSNSDEVEPVKKSSVSPKRSLHRRDPKNGIIKKQTGFKSNKLKVKSIERHSPERPLRHSTRTKVKPVAWWRNEHIVYETKKENGAYVMEVKDVVHRPDLSSIPRVSKQKASSISPVKKKKEVGKRTDRLSTPKRHRKQVKKVVDLGHYMAPERQPEAVVKALKRGTGEPDEPEEHRELKVQDDRHEVESAKDHASSGKLLPFEEPMDNINGSEWMDNKALTVPVFEGPGSENQIERTVAWAPGQSKNTTIIRNREEYFRIRTLFDQDSEFSGGGIIELPVNSRKAVKSNDDTYFIFYVIDGVLEVSLSHNVFVVTGGCSFEIPMGNFYQFENKGQSPVKLFFVQSKYVVISNLNDDEMDNYMDDN